MSWLRYLTLKSFRVLNPDWGMRLYRCKTTNSATWGSREVQDTSTYKGTDYLSRVSELGVLIIDWESPIQELLPPAHTCDICQWDILRSTGGFYSDMDILYVKPINYAEYGGSDVIYCLSQGYMTIGFFGASENNLLFDAIFNEAVTSYNKHEYQTAGADAVLRMVGANRRPGSGTYAFDLFAKMYPRLKFLQLLDQVIYPWPWDRLDSIWGRVTPIPSTTVGIHWFGGAGLSQDMNILLTPDNVRNVKCTLTNSIVANPHLLGG